ncbi:MAG: tripartite tricarboxylate transporter substrate binding protein [Betaproteobacteria bacterium]|nr:tripartite tricarboxylate transporter substrate binding protein [Betaproteobacteria bacterium]
MRDVRRAGYAWPCVVALGVALGCAQAGAQSAQSTQSAPAAAFPGKPVRYVVPFGAGTSPDLVGRLLADRLTRLWNQQVIVENRVGAAGVLGSSFVAKAPSDGYTLLQCNVGSNAIAVSLHQKVPYDQLRDFAPVTRIGVTANIITAHPSVPMRSLKDFVAYAKANPGKLSYSAGLVGVSPQLTMELLKLRLKFDVVHIPYKVGSQAISDTIAGQVPFNVSNLPAIVAPVQSGRLRALAVTSAQRMPQLPDVPTVQESGVPDFEVYTWQGVCAPGATSVPLLEKLNADFTTVLRMADMRERMNELVMPPAPTTRDGFEQFIRGEIKRWAQVIQEAGIPKQ